MGFKTITIKEGVYESLLPLKRAGESFSELLARLAGRKDSDIMRFAGALKRSKEANDGVREFILEYKREATRSFERRIKRLT
ncbi:hypothetical protein HY546_02370 [archaeon]|nr:hypothetical protein [archaeon]